MYALLFKNMLKAITQNYHNIQINFIELLFFNYGTSQEI